MKVALTISLPDTMRAYIDEQVRSGHYSTPSEYIRSLVRQEQEKGTHSRVRAQELLLHFTAKDLAALKEVARQASQQKKRNGSRGTGKQRSDDGCG